MSADTHRPGGWVDGIGWISLADPAVLKNCIVKFNALAGDAEVAMNDTLPVWLRGRIVTVVRWADGSVPAPKVSQ